MQVPVGIKRAEYISCLSDHSPPPKTMSTVNGVNGTNGVNGSGSTNVSP